MERCAECGFTYDEAAAAEAAGMIRGGEAELAAILEAGHAGLRRRRQADRWSALEYACHVRDMPDVARQLRDAARLFASDLGRLSAPDWDRRVIYTYPERAERSLRWLAIRPR